jgi:hypothetical protein
MTVTRKVLGQQAPAAATWVDLYTCGASGGAIVSTLSACNRGLTDAAVRVAIRPSGAVLATTHYVYFDAKVPTKDTLTSTIGLTLSSTDVVSVYSDTGNVSFSLFGQETT